MRPRELKQVLPKYINHRAPVIITGAPGIGKTDIIKQVCESMGVEYIITHPITHDPIDYKGFPKLCDDKATFVPYDHLLALRDAKKPTVMFFDDLGQSLKAVQAGCMQLFLERKINGHPVSEFITFIAATNRRQDMAGVDSLIEPLKSRFYNIIKLEVDLDDWIYWAIQNGMPPELIAYMKFKPDTLSMFKPTPELINTPCPRTIAHVGEMSTWGFPSEMEYETYAGAAGEGFATGYCAFLKTYRDLPDIDDIIRNPESAPIPDIKRGDILWSIVITLSYRTDDKNFGNIIKYFTRMPAEFQMVGMQSILVKNPKLESHKEFTKWATKNSHFFIPGK